MKDQIVFRDDLLMEARTMLNAGEVGKLKDNRIVPIGDIIFENQILIKPPQTFVPSSSKVNHGSLSPDRNYGNNSQLLRLPAPPGRFAPNPNYIDRAERLE